MVPPAPAGIVARGGPGSGCLCSLVRFYAHMVKAGWLAGRSSFWIQAVPGFAWSIYLGVGLPVLIFALIGSGTTIIRVKPRAEVAPEWAALAGLAVATFILHCVVPTGVESRYMVTADAFSRSLLRGRYRWHCASTSALAYRSGLSASA